MGAVVVFLPCVELVVIVNEVPAVHIVNEAIAVIVNTVAGNLILIDPHGVLKVRVIHINTRVNDCHNDRTFVLNLIIKFPGRL